MRLATILTVMMCLLACLVTPARARDGAENWAIPGSTCHAVMQPGEDAAFLVSRAERWTCEAGEWPSTGETVLLRFDMRGRQTADPVLTVSTRLFDRLTVTATSQGGASVTRRVAVEDLTVSNSAWLHTHDVATPPGKLSVITVQFEGVVVPPRLAPTRISDGPPAKAVATYDQIVSAILAGLLFAPILFDLGFYLVLRKSFTLYHALFCTMAVIQTTAVSGLMHLLLGVSPATQHVLAQISFDTTVAAGTMFAASFLEREQLGDRGRVILRAIAALALVLCLQRLLLAEALGVTVMQIYYGGYAVFILGLAVALARPLRRASRALRFVLLSYLPLLAIGIGRITSALATNMVDTLQMAQAQHLALGWQVIVSAFAVADRFMTIKRERDRARAAAEVAERASERDPLTGLLNRRGLERLFVSMRADGCSALAVIDLDHFKAVNDSYGHAAGDRVLQVVADALCDGDPASRVFRMGGEEFVILLGGPDPLGEAEARRRAITAAVRAAGVIGRDVTASMGVVDAPPDAISDASFDALYDRADRLLYEAKASGRDRGLSERLRVFRPRRMEDRRAAA